MGRGTQSRHDRFEGRVSVMKPHRDLDIMRENTWHLARRIRKMHEGGEVPMLHGLSETGETCVGNRRKHIPNRKRKTPDGRGTIGKAAIAEVKGRETDRVAARRVEGAGSISPQVFHREPAEPDAALRTDKACACARMRKTGLS